MKQVIFMLVGLGMLYIFTILTSQDTSIYNGMSLQVGQVPAFSYEDATKIAESLR